MILVFIIIILLCIPTAGERALKLYATFPAFRFTFVIAFILAATGIDIMILKKYKVNYLFIFELDPTYKITHVQFFRVSNLSIIYSYLDCNSIYVHMVHVLHAIAFHSQA